jgi:hypothetical protein
MVVAEHDLHRCLSRRSDAESIATTASIDSKDSAQQPVPSIKVSSPPPGDDVDAPDSEDVVLRQKKTDYNKVSCYFYAADY